MAVTTKTKENKTKRDRIFPATCGTCKHFYPEGLDEPDDPSFCVLDGDTVIIYQACADWEQYHGQPLTTTFKPRTIRGAGSIK